MKEVVVVFKDADYAALMAAWAAVVPAGCDDRLPFSEFIRVSAQTGVFTLLRLFMDRAEGKV